jgi:hypothetical protein
MPPTPESAGSVPRLAIAEVKYSLPQMLEELKAERAASSFAMEKLDQHEIGKLFKAKASTRAKSKK